MLYKLALSDIVNEGAASIAIKKLLMPTIPARERIVMDAVLVVEIFSLVAFITIVSFLPLVYINLQSLYHSSIPSVSLNKIHRQHKRYYGRTTLVAPSFIKTSRKRRGESFLAWHCGVFLHVPLQ